MKKIFLTALALAGLTLAQAQIKEGTVTYTVNVEGVPPEQASMMKGMEMKTYFKDGKSRTEFSSAFMSSTTISNDEGTLILMDGMGQKSFIKMTKADIEKENKGNPEPKISYTDEKKTIAGYECKKAVVEVKTKSGETQKANVWYTEKIPYSNAGKMSAQFKGLKGAPLEFDSFQGPMKMIMSATNVTTTPVADNKFIASTEGYTEMKMDDLKKMRGGN